MKKRGLRLKDVDLLWSRYIRARDGRCQWDVKHFRYGPRECIGPLQAAHVHSRRYHAIRFDEGNCFALCLGHHKYETEHPIEGRWFWRGFIGPEAYEALEKIGHVGLNGGHLDLKAIAADLREKLKEIEAA